jgi:hypothetical protein
MALPPEWVAVAAGPCRRLTLHCQGTVHLAGGFQEGSMCELGLKRWGEFSVGKSRGDARLRAQQEHSKGRIRQGALGQRVKCVLCMCLEYGLCGAVLCVVCSCCICKKICMWYASMCSISLCPVCCVCYVECGLCGMCVLYVVCCGMYVMNMWEGTVCGVGGGPIWWEIIAGLDCEGMGPG